MSWSSSARRMRASLVAFWAAILGGIVPVPVAVGISDEHRLKLFRILQPAAARDAVYGGRPAGASAWTLPKNGKS